MKHIVLLTKTYNINDFDVWYKYHKAMGWTVHAIDNESKETIKSHMNLTNGDTYDKLVGWPDQWKLFSDILNENRFGFSEGELVAFIDDDEYIWFYQDYWKKYEEMNPKFASKTYKSLDAYVDECLAKFPDENILLMPQILMSTPCIHDSRGLQTNLIDFATYRRNDASAQGKCIIKYTASLAYDFKYCYTDEQGHIPFVVSAYASGFGDHAIRHSVVNGCAISNTTYGAVDPNACLRLYHYHIKTRQDWEMKFNRGSAAVEYQWYDHNIYKNINAGGYIIPDFTMLETKKLYHI